MDLPVRRKLSDLKPHPINEQLFADPQLVDGYPRIKENIRQHGLTEPIVVKQNGTVISGHLLYVAALEVCNEGEGANSVLVQLHIGFPDEERENEYVVNASTSFLAPRQQALAYKLLLDGVPERRDRRGRKRKDEQTVASLDKKRATRERMARVLRTSVATADNLLLVYQTAGVPTGLQAMVDEGKLPLTLAAEAVRFGVNEAYRRDPDAKPDAIRIDPIDIQAFVDFPPETVHTLADTLRGRLPKKHIRLANSALEPKPRARQKPESDRSAHGLTEDIPLHETIHQLHIRLEEAYAKAGLIHESKIEEAIELLIEKAIKVWKKATGQSFTVRIERRRSAESLAQEEVERPVEKTVRASPVLHDVKVSKKPAQPSEPATFATEVEFITSVLGEDLIQALS